MKLLSINAKIGLLLLAAIGSPASVSAQLNGTAAADAAGQTANQTTSQTTGQTGARSQAVASARIVRGETIRFGGMSNPDKAAILAAIDSGKLSIRLPKARIQSQSTGSSGAPLLVVEFF